MKTQKKIDEFDLFLKTIEKKHDSKKEFISHFVNWLGKNSLIANTENFNKKKSYDFNANRIINTNAKKPYRFDLESAIGAVPIRPFGTNRPNEDLISKND